MVEAFVRTLKRDYVRVNATPDAGTVIEQLPAWLANYNEVHPHKSLGYRSIREYINQTREVLSGILGATTLESRVIFAIIVILDFWLLDAQISIKARGRDNYERYPTAVSGWLKP